MRKSILAIALTVAAFYGVANAMTQDEALTSWPKTIEHTWYLGQYSRAAKLLFVGMDAGRIDNDASACQTSTASYVYAISQYPGPLADADVVEFGRMYARGRAGDAGCGDSGL